MDFRTCSVEDVKSYDFRRMVKRIAAEEGIEEYQGWYRLGRNAESWGQYHKAIECYGKVIATAPIFGGNAETYDATMRRDALLKKI